MSFDCQIFVEFPSNPNTTKPSAPSSAEATSPAPTGPWRSPKRSTKLGSFSYVDTQENFLVYTAAPHDYAMTRMMTFQSPFLAWPHSDGQPELFCYSRQGGAWIRLPVLGGAEWDGS